MPTIPSARLRSSGAPTRRAAWLILGPRDQSLGSTDEPTRHFSIRAPRQKGMSPPTASRFALQELYGLVLSGALTKLIYCIINYNNWSRTPCRNPVHVGYFSKRFYELNQDEM